MAFKTLLCAITLVAIVDLVIYCSSDF